MTSPYFRLAVRISASERGAVIRPAALLPCPEYSRRRPVALRPTLSSGLPFSGTYFVITIIGCFVLLDKFKQLIDLLAKFVPF